MHFSTAADISMPPRLMSFSLMQAASSLMLAGCCPHIAMAKPRTKIVDFNTRPTSDGSISTMTLWEHVAKARVFDLAQDYFIGMPHYPTHPPFLFGLTKQ